MDSLRENVIKSPYDLREMLWYVIPGATFLLLIFLFEYWFAVQIRGVELKNRNKVTTENIQLNDSVEVVGMELNFRAQKNDTELTKNKYLIVANSIQKNRTNLLAKLHTPVFTALTVTHTGENIIGENWVSAAIYLLLLLSVCYILGHMTYMIGTFLFERGLIMKGYSYPYLKLLGLREHERKKTIEIIASQSYYKGLYFWISTIVISIYILFPIIAAKQPLNYEIFKYSVLTVCIILIIIPTRLKFILANITDWTLEKKKGTPEISGVLFWWIFISIILFLSYVFRFDYKIEPFLPGLVSFALEGSIVFFVCLSIVILVEHSIRQHSQKKEKANKMISKFQKIKEYVKIKFVAKIPLEFEKAYYEVLFTKYYNYFGNEIDKFSNNYFHTSNKFDTNFIEKYRKAFFDIYQIEYSKLRTHNYWLPKFFVMENSTYLNQQINFWENNSRFTKSLSASFLMAFAYCSISVMFQYRTMYDILNEVNSQWEGHYYRIMVLLLIPIAYFIITAFVVRYYMYIYDNRFQRMVLRSFVSLVASKDFESKQYFKKESPNPNKVDSGRS